MGELTEQVDLAVGLVAADKRRTSMLGIAARKTRQVIVLGCIVEFHLVVVYARALPLLLPPHQQEAQMAVHSERVYLNLTVADIALVAVARRRWHSWDEPPSEAVAAAAVVVDSSSLPSPPEDDGFERREFARPSPSAW